MNYYSHHIGDFIRDTARLPDSQCMAYLRMIWLYYETENPLENDADAIAFKIGANASDVHQILRHFFFLHDDGLWHQARCDKEILAFRQKSDKAKKSANARWDNANAMRTHNGRNANEPVFHANQEPITKNQLIDPSDLVGGVPTDNRVVPIRPDIPDCPHQEIIALYHEILPTLTQVRKWDGARAKSLTARWRENPKHQRLDYWRGFFGYVAKSDFLMGRTTRWRADLEWLTKSGNFTKVIEGKYENEEAQQ